MSRLIRICLLIKYSLLSWFILISLLHNATRKFGTFFMGHPVYICISKKTSRCNASDRLHLQQLALTRYWHNAVVQYHTENELHHRYHSNLSLYCHNVTTFCTNVTQFVPINSLEQSQQLTSWHTTLLTKCCSSSVTVAFIKCHHKYATESSVVAQICMHQLAPRTCV